jgi:hypothetical protein
VPPRSDLLARYVHRTQEAYLAFSADYTGPDTAGQARVINGDCGPGRYNAGFAVGCKACGSGTYQTGVGMVSPSDCAQCAAGSYQSGVGLTSAKACASCQPGGYQAASGASACSMCGPGAYQTGVGMVADNCTVCGPGTYQSGRGIGNCTQCSPGTYQSAPSAASCEQCGPGLYQTGSGVLFAANCSLCQPGTFQSGLGSPVVCGSCMPGTYASGVGSSFCTQCDVGASVNRSGALECLPCSPGSFATASGKSACFRCPAGTFTAPYAVAFNASVAAARNASEQVSLLDCGGTEASNSSCGACSGVTVCPASVWQPAAAGCPAVPCPNVSGNASAGNATLGIGSARNQPSGAYARNASANSSLYCSPGWDVNRSAGRCLVGCIECGPGTYLAYEGALSATACLRCASGTYTPLRGQSTCVDCPSGSYSTGTGFTTCVACLSGRFSNQSRMVTARTCLLCPPGAAAPFKGASLCGLCPAGTFQTGAGRTSCALCRGGKYSTSLGASAASACVACPKGKFSLSGSVNRAGCYCLPQYAPEDPANLDIDSQDCVPSPTCGAVPGCGAGQICAPPPDGGQLRCVATSSLPPRCTGPIPSTCSAAGADPVWVSMPNGSSLPASLNPVSGVVAQFPKSVTVSAQWAAGWWQVLCPHASRFGPGPIPVILATASGPICSFYVGYNPRPAAVVPTAIPLLGGEVLLNLSSWSAWASTAMMPCQASLAHTIRPSITGWYTR